MTLETFMNYNWGAMMPEFIILGVATLLALMDLFLPAAISRRPFAWFAAGGVLVAFLSLIGLMQMEPVSILADTFMLDPFAKLFKMIILAGGVLVLLMSESDRPKEGMHQSRGEFQYLFLTALLGAMIMTSSGDVITLFVGLELLSLSSYIMVGIRKSRLDSNESAVKYVVNGGIATAVTLFGFSYLYGLTGTTNMAEMGGIMAQMLDGQYQYLLGIAFFMVFVGLSFKIAAAPFHMWAPDVYQGAPPSVGAFLSVIGKTAGFVLILRIIVMLYQGAPGDTYGALSFMEKNSGYIAFIAAVTMITGNLIALMQKDIKRLLAYSSIAHAGYLLVSLTTHDYFTASTVWFYLTAYLFMTLGAFAVVQFVTDKSDSSDMDVFAGLHKKSPLLAVMLALFFLSMAGIPGTAGFIAKLHIFLGAFAASPSNYVLIGILMGATVVSYVYYFRVCVRLFFRPANFPFASERIRLPVSLLLVLVICAAGTIGLGLMPDIGLDLYRSFLGNG